MTAPARTLVLPDAAARLVRVVTFAAYVAAITWLSLVLAIGVGPAIATAGGQGSDVTAPVAAPVHARPQPAPAPVQQLDIVLPLR